MPEARRTAGIIAIGDELTLGQKLDTNSQWIADRLLDCGVGVTEHRTVSDTRESIAGALTQMAQRCDLLVVSGGLGPTADDLTRHALADALGDELVEDSLALAQILEWFKNSARSMPESNRVQALRPASAECIENSAGTAPGLAAAIGSTSVFCLPGPPRELRPMFEMHVAPELKEQSGPEIQTSFVHAFGLGESKAAELLGELMDRTRNPLVGTTASGGVITCRIRAVGATDDPDDRLSATVDMITQRLGAHVFGFGDDTLASVVLDQLRVQNHRLTTIESCTGGLLGSMITDIPGSSDAYTGGWVTYTNEMKTSLVGVPPEVFQTDGAVSKRCALAMAEGGLVHADADHALAITGIAGPGGGSAEKPAGTVWIVRASRDAEPDARCFRFPGERSNVRAWSVRSALMMLHLHLVGQTETTLLRQTNPVSQP